MITPQDKVIAVTCMIGIAIILFSAIYLANRMSK